MLGMMTQMQAQAQMQHDLGQNQVNQILAMSETQRVDAKQREEAQRAEALKREEMLIQAKMNADQINADREKCQIDREKCQIEANQKREQALLKLKAETEEGNQKTGAGPSLTENGQ